MKTNSKYLAMDAEYQKYCDDTFQACKNIDHEFKSDAELFDSIVNYYYKEFTAMPPGWFNYFD